MNMSQIASLSGISIPGMDQFIMMKGLVKLIGMKPSLEG
jgi:hypothetical protein